MHLAMLHGIIFMYLIYRIFHYFIYRYLVYGLGMSYGEGSFLAFVIVLFLAWFFLGRKRR